MLDINEVINRSEYEFIMTNPVLGNNIIFITFGGSHSYGTNIENSDIDIRGIAMDDIDSILGINPFNQYDDDKTDTTIFGFKRIVDLLITCNPHTIEMLGCKPEHYALVSDYGRQLLANKQIFLSKYAYITFSEYASNQLRRMQNALARDKASEEEKEVHILNSLKSALRSFEEVSNKVAPGVIELYIPGVTDTSCSQISKQLELIRKSNEKIHINLNGTGLSLREFNGVMLHLDRICRDYDKLNNRNKKKDDIHLNKHAMHLIRLYIMGYDILYSGEIVTYREKEHDLLMDIRSGKYMDEQGLFKKEFYQLVDYYTDKLTYALNKSPLPNRVNMDEVNKFKRMMLLDAVRFGG